MNTAAGAQGAEETIEISTKSEAPWTVAMLTGALIDVTAEDMFFYGEELGEMKDGETVIGDVPDEAQRFFTLGMIFRKEASELEQKVKGGLERIRILLISSGIDKLPEELHNDVHRLRELSEKIDALDRLGWISLKDHFGWSCKTAIGVRNGWKIVQLAPKKQIIEIGVIGIGGMGFGFFDE